MNKLGKPTIDEIKVLHAKCLEYYQPLFNLYKDVDEKLYELDFKGALNLPLEFKDEGVVLPTARDMVDTCVDHTDIANARVYVNRKGTTDISESEANMMRKFYLGLIHRTNVESTISPWRVGAKHYWMHGMACFKTVWDADRSPDKPEQKKGESEDNYAAGLDKWRSDYSATMPIVIQAVNPGCIMPDPYDIGGRFLFETDEVLVYNVKERFPRWGNPQGRSLEQKVTRTRFWTPKYRCELYDGEPVLKGDVIAHDYGFIPYVIIDTGLGNVSANNNPTTRYVGVLRYIAGLLVSESSSYSLSDIVLKRTSFPWGTIEGDNAAQVGTIDIGFGKFTKMPVGTKLMPQYPQTVAQELSRHLGVTAGYVSAHIAPNVTRGLGEEGVRSGVDRRLLLSEASARYIYSNEAFKNGAAKVLANCARVFKNVVPGELRVWARTPRDEFDVKIDKNMMKEPFTCYVEFAPFSEEDEYRRHDDLERLMKSGIVTRSWARTQMSNVDPEAMELEEEVERLKASPAVQQVIDQYAMSKILEAVAKRSAAESVDNAPPPVPEQLMQMMPGMPVQPGQAQPGGAPRAMQPPIPNVAPLGSAQNVQNELAKQRSATPMTQQGQGGGGFR